MSRRRHGASQRLDSDVSPAASIVHCDGPEYRRYIPCRRRGPAPRCTARCTASPRPAEQTGPFPGPARWESGGRGGGLGAGRSTKSVGSRGCWADRSHPLFRVVCLSGSSAARGLSVSQTSIFPKRGEPPRNLKFLCVRCDIRRARPRVKAGPAVGPRRGPGGGTGLLVSACVGSACLASACPSPMLIRVPCFKLSGSLTCPSQPRVRVLCSACCARGAKQAPLGVAQALRCFICSKRSLFCSFERASLVYARGPACFQPGCGCSCRGIP
jgi:hypothetical protein